MVKTGDAAQYGVYLVFFIIAAGVGVIYLVNRKRKKYK
jgi:LPXTG-motif cell wall-anchored protein